MSGLNNMHAITILLFRYMLAYNIYYAMLCRPSVTSKEVYTVHFGEDTVERDQIVAQATKDWETFLIHRAKELVPGIVRLRLVLLEVSVMP